MEEGTLIIYLTLYLSTEIYGSIQVYTELIQEQLGVFL